MTARTLFYACKCPFVWMQDHICNKHYSRRCYDSDCADQVINCFVFSLDTEWTGEEEQGIAMSTWPWPLPLSGDLDHDPADPVCGAAEVYLHPANRGPQQQACSAAGSDSSHHTADARLRWAATRYVVMGWRKTNCRCKLYSNKLIEWWGLMLQHIRIKV